MTRSTGHAHTDKVKLGLARMDVLWTPHIINALERLKAPERWCVEVTTQNKKDKKHESKCNRDS